MNTVYLKNYKTKTINPNKKSSTYRSGSIFRSMCSLTCEPDIDEAVTLEVVVSS